MEVSSVSGLTGFHALCSRDAVLSSAENFILYLLLETKAQGATAKGRLPLNLGIVLDRSGSMYDEATRLCQRSGQIPS